MMAFTECPVDGSARRRSETVALGESCRAVRLARSND